MKEARENQPITGNLILRKSFGELRVSGMWFLEQRRLTLCVLKAGEGEMAASSRAQFFSLYPVLKIQPTIARQITKNPSVIARLTATLTSDDS